MVTVPVRRSGASFDSTWRVTTPGPCPVAPTITVIHGAWLTAVQAQPPWAETATS